MSIQHVGAVLDVLTELRALDAFVLISIANGADRDTGWSYTTLKRMARHARCTQRGARKALRRLELGGYLRTEPAKLPGRASAYRLLFGIDGKRLPEAELYAPRAVSKAAPKRGGEPSSGGRRSPPVSRSGGREPRSGGEEPESNPPNNPLIGVSVSSPGFNQRAAKSSGRQRAKRIPDERPEPDRAAELERQRAGLKALAAKLAGEKVP